MSMKGLIDILDSSSYHLTPISNQCLVLAIFLRTAIGINSEPIQRAVGDSPSIIQHHGQPAPTYSLKPDELAWGVVISLNPIES